MDQIASLTYPDGEVVTNSFDQGRQVLGLRGNSSYVSAIGNTPLKKQSQAPTGLGEGFEAKPSPAAAGLENGLKLSPGVQPWLDRTSINGFDSFVF